MDHLSHKIIHIADLPGHTDRAWHIAWNPTKPLLASCSADKTVRIYAYTSPGLPPTEKTYNFTPLSNIPTGHAKTVRAVAWAPSGRTLATASFDSNIGIWEREGTGVAENPSHTHQHGEGCAHVHGEHLHAHRSDEDEEGGDEGTTTSGDWEWECMSTLEGHETECKSVAYSASGTLLASCSRDKTVWIWEVHPDGDFETISVLMEHSQDVKCVAWHPTEEILASGSYDDTIKLYIDDPSDDWFTFATLTGHTSTVWSLAWSPAFSSSRSTSTPASMSTTSEEDPTGRSQGYLASCSQDNTVRVWQRTGQYTWECVLVLDGHERSVYGVSWGRGRGRGRGVPSRSTDEEGEKKEGEREKGYRYLGWLASVGGDGNVFVWELWETASPLPLPSAPSPSGNNPTPTLNHKLIARLESAHGVHDVNAVAWCPRVGHEDLLATAADDGGVRVWRVVPVEGEGN